MELIFSWENDGKGCFNSVISTVCFELTQPNLKSDKCTFYTAGQKIMLPERPPKFEFYVRTDDTECKPPPFPATYQLERFKRI